ncbi:MAG: 1-phosphofructokinase family hexose kinase [Flavobacteriaceae bacterium]
MRKIVTLTVNPAIDKSTFIEGIKPFNKLRCQESTYEPGGGGINVSKVLKELGGTSLCMYMAGGPTGTHLKEMLADLDILQQLIPIAGRVRENLSVTDTLNNQTYRFGMPGPTVMENEWKNVLGHLEAILLEGDILVASGSICSGMPTNFFAQVAKIAHEKKVKYILDTNGEALVKGAEAGVYLLKPNLGELATLCGVQTIPFLELESMAKAYLQNNPCELMIVSLGAQGAVMVTKEQVEYIAAPIVYRKNNNRAGDSMVAGMVFAMTQGKTISEMAQYGVACGTAAIMTEGSQPCRIKDVEELYQWIQANSLNSGKIKINA